MSKRVRNSWLLVGVLCAALAVCIIAFLLWARQPVVEQAASSSVQGVSSNNREQKPLRGINFVTTVPADITIKSNQTTPHGDVVEQMFLSSTATSIEHPISDQLGITIGMIPSGGMKAISDIQLRLSNSGTYGRIQRDEITNDHMAFIKQDDRDYEVSVFWNDGQRYASVVVSGTPARQSELEQMLHSILSSWQWQ